MLTLRPTTLVPPTFATLGSHPQALPPALANAQGALFEVTVPRPRTLLKQALLGAVEAPITPILRRPYAHGGFMALAHQMLLQPAWMTIQRTLTPGLHAQVAAILSGGAITSVLPMAMAVMENTPVIAAYGTLRAAHNRPPIEWDIWLDPTDPTSLDKARVIHGNLSAETLAYQNPAASRILLSQSVDGSDVHLGISPSNYLKAFRTALAQSGRRAVAEETLEVMLDVKSTYSTPEDIDAFVVACRAANVRVVGAGTFLPAQIVGLKATQGVWLFDHPEDIIAAQAEEKMTQSTHAMCNGGFLLEQNAEGHWAPDAKLVGRLRIAQQKASLQLSVYVQETRADPQALDALTRLINSEPELFTGGFAYGGQEGSAQSAIGPGRGAIMLYAETL